MQQELKILGIVGSLRQASYNRALMRAAQELAPKGVVIEIADISKLPLFDQDLEDHVPDEVTLLREQIKAADSILFATPEYNYSLPGVLKNAIDWGSRPYSDNSFRDKPAAIMGATAGGMGTSRAQYHLRQIFVTLNIHGLNQPEVMVAGASKKINENGTVTDETTRELIQQMLVALVDWTKRLNS